MDSETSSSSFGQLATLQFMTYAARGFVLPFINLYLVSVGFTGSQIGNLASFSALTQLIITPLLHTWADRTGLHRRLYYGLLIGNICACVGLVGMASSQLGLSLMVLLRDWTDLPGAALLSQLSLTWLEQHKRSIYGRLRGMGSFGWAVSTLIAGRIQSLGLVFIASAASNAVLLPLVRILPKRANEPHAAASGSSKRPRGLIILLASLFVFYIGSSAFSAFSNVYYKYTLGASNEMVGLLASLAALSEIPAMMLIDYLLRRADLRLILVIGMLGLGGLWFLLAQLAGPTLLIPLMLTRGTFYTFQAVAMTLLVAMISPGATKATNQALAQATIPSVAVLVSGSLSGWLFDHIGPRQLFTLAALTASLAALIVLSAWRQLKAPITSERRA